MLEGLRNQPDNASGKWGPGTPVFLAQSTGQKAMLNGRPVQSPADSPTQKEGPDSPTLIHARTLPRGTSQNETDSVGGKRPSRRIDGHGMTVPPSGAARPARNAFSALEVGGWGGGLIPCLGRNGVLALPKKGSAFGPNAKFKDTLHPWLFGLQAQPSWSEKTTPVF